jgi:hypothetical protein
LKRLSYDQFNTTNHIQGFLNDLKSEIIGKIAPFYAIYIRGVRPKKKKKPQNYIIQQGQGGELTCFHIF